ncbi:MAG: HAD-IA family hydrolase [Pseudomonadales bacterium]|jgi:phosphoglycolate phosphatase|tara:strand:- start:2050 stop:2742 length:693 start_codon:yes stop_codon:yes gene_type:complete
MPDIDTLIFDWDGTLSDSVGHIVSAMRAAAEEAMMPVPDVSAVRGIIGLGLPEAVAALYPQEGDNQRLAAVVGCYRHQYRSQEVQPVSLFPGVLEALARWRAEGYRLAVATGKGRNGLGRMLAQHDLLGYFDATRCADETASKPHPLMLQEILQELGSLSSAAIMVGDSSFDLDMAANANVRAVAATYGAQSREQLLRCAPVHCIDEFAELAGWLSKSGRVGRKTAIGEA